jgi:hypothetical protein
MSASRFRGKATSAHPEDDVVGMPTTFAGLASILVSGSGIRVAPPGQVRHRKRRTAIITRRVWPVQIIGAKVAVLAHDPAHEFHLGHWHQPKEHSCDVAVAGVGVGDLVRQPFASDYVGYEP